MAQPVPSYTKKDLNIGINHVPNWTVQHAVAELVANAIDQGHGFKYELSPDAMTLVIENPGRLELKHWVMNATGDMKNSDQNGGFGCGMKDALAPLRRNDILYACESYTTKYELADEDRPDEGKVLLLKVSSVAAARVGTTRITLTSTKGFPLPRREDVCFSVPDGARAISKKKDMEIYADRPSHLPVVIWVRDVYRFEVEDSVGGYLVKVLKLDQGMREKLGRDRRNASSVALVSIIKTAYSRIRDAESVAQLSQPSLPTHIPPQPSLPANIPPQFRPPARKAPAGTRSAPVPNHMYVRHLQKQVEDLTQQLREAESEHTFAVEDIKKLRQDMKRLEDMTQSLICQLATLRLPTFSTTATKIEVNDYRMEEWVKSKEPSEAFQSQVKEIRGAFRAAFPNGCAFYGSSSDGTDTAMNDSDVDLGVVFPPFSSLQEHLKTKMPLLTLTSDGIHNPNCPTALMYHWTYKDLVGEVVVFPNERDFPEAMKQRRVDPLSNLTEREARGVKFMKRLRIAAFGGLYPKSRFLTHVVHQVHSKDSPQEAAKDYSYSRYIPLYLDAFLKLSAANMDYYNRYTDDEWSQIKMVIRCVQKAFGLTRAEEERAAA